MPWRQRACFICGHKPAFGTIHANRLVPACTRCLNRCIDTDVLLDFVNKQLAREDESGTGDADTHAETAR